MLEFCKIDAFSFLLGCVNHRQSVCIEVVAGVLWESLGGFIKERFLEVVAHGLMEAA